MWPSKGDMIDMVSGLCLIQDKIKAEYGMPDFIQEPKVANIEALKIQCSMCGINLDMAALIHCHHEEQTHIGLRVSSQKKKRLMKF